MLISEMLCRNRRWYRLKMHTAQFCASAAAAAAAAAVVVIFFSVDTIACIRSTACVCVCVSTLFIVSIAWTDFDRANSSDYMKMVCYVCMHCALCTLCTSPSRYIPIRCIWLVIYCVDLCGVMEIQCNVFLFYSAIHSFHVRFGGRKTERQNKEIAVEFWHRWKCPQVERSYSL